MASKSRRQDKKKEAANSLFKSDMCYQMKLLNN